MHQITAPPNVQSGMMAKWNGKLWEIGRSMEACSVWDVSYDRMLCMTALTCPQNAPNAKYHMLQYYYVHLRYGNWT